MKISKELFEAVSEIKVDSIEVQGDFIIATKRTSMIRVSVYEFFFKCKEFALKHGYHIESLMYDSRANNIYDTGIAKVLGCNPDYMDLDSFKADSEQQAVFTACEQILEWTKNK